MVSDKIQTRVQIKLIHTIKFRKSVVKKDISFLLIEQGVGTTQSIDAFILKLESAEVILFLTTLNMLTIVIVDNRHFPLCCSDDLDRP